MISMTNSSAPFKKCVLFWCPFEPRKGTAFQFSVLHASYALHVTLNCYVLINVQCANGNSVKNYKTMQCKNIIQQWRQRGQENEKIARVGICIHKMTMFWLEQCLNKCVWRHTFHHILFPVQTYDCNLSMFWIFNIIRHTFSIVKFGEQLS
jgi:hypothetical protein